MYLCKLRTAVVSSDNKIQNIAESITLPEDCECTFKTIPSAEEAETGGGSILIIDNNIDVLKNARSTGAEYIAFLAPAADMGNLSPELYSQADCIWPVIEGEHSEQMLKYNMTTFIEAIKRDFDNDRLKVCFETAIDSVPDLIWFKDIIGAHLIVNNGFCNAVEKTKEQIYKKGHYYIWDIPKEEYEQGDYVCLESEEVVIRAGETCLFDEKVKTKSGMRQFKTYKSPLIDKHGECFGTCGIAKDVTDLHNINNELQIVLESMPFAVMVEDFRGVTVSCNSKFSEFFPQVAEMVGSSCAQWKRSILDDGALLKNGSVEITANTEDGERILIVNEEPITDIFHEQIGVVNIFRDVTLESNYQKQTIRMANTDFLTALNNRRSLFSFINRQKNTPDISMIMVDLDNFKGVNDKYGHQMGDYALMETARILKSCFENDFIARMGGDEFLVVITEEKSRDDIKAEAENLLVQLNDYFKSKPEFSELSASIGVSQSPAGSKEQDVENLIHMSDRAMYNAKNSGNGKCCICDE